MRVRDPPAAMSGALTRHVVACLQCLRGSCDEGGGRAFPRSQTAVFALPGPHHEEVKAAVSVAQ